ncbi:MAG: histidine phosphatase family protein [Rhizobiaceae bacterium]
MSRVYLLRHAKAASALPGKRDFDRHLSAGGAKMAARLGQTMAGKSLIPDLVICSPSVRTRETWAEIAIQMPFEIETRFDRALYDGPPGSYFDAIRSGDAKGSILIIGHNPMTEETAFQLAGGANPDAIALLDKGYPPGGLTVFDLAGDLSAAKAKSGFLQVFLTDGIL